MIRNPCDLVIALKHSLLDLLYIHEPAGHCLIDERHTCAVAEWIGVEIVLPLHKLSAFLEILDDGLVCILYKDTFPFRDFRGESALFVHRAYYRASWDLSLHGVVVVFTEA